MPNLLRNDSNNDRSQVSLSDLFFNKTQEGTSIEHFFKLNIKEGTPKERPKQHN